MQLLNLTLFILSFRNSQSERLQLSKTMCSRVSVREKSQLLNSQSLNSVWLTVLQRIALVKSVFWKRSLSNLQELNNLLFVKRQLLSFALIKSPEISDSEKLTCIKDASPIICRSLKVQLVNAESFTVALSKHREVRCSLVTCMPSILADVKSVLPRQ